LQATNCNHCSTTQSATSVRSNNSRLYPIGRSPSYNPKKERIQKICSFFISLIPCPKTPTDDRETTKRRPREERQNFFTKFRRFFTQILHMSKKKCTFVAKIE
jgi:hypothetical protein